MTVAESLDLLDVARDQHDRAVPFTRELRGWRGMAEWLFEADRIIKLNLPVVMDDGYVHNFTGFRVLHSAIRGPGIGGIRLHPRVRESEIVALAMGTTWKCGLVDLPFGGAAGGVQCDPHRLSERELEGIIRRYITALGDHIGPHTDIPSPDLYTTERTMAWVYDTYDMLHPGTNNLPAVVGKPADMGGSLASRTATAMGILFVVEHLLELGVVPELSSLSGASIAVQGFGDVGGNAAHILQEAGARVVAVSDSAGGIYQPDGLDIGRVTEHKSEAGSVTGFSGAKPLNGLEILELPCDILLPAALECQITLENAPRIEAKVVVEGASGPTTPAADLVLADRGVRVIPDILANAGGVVVGYFEWVQNLDHQKWDEYEVTNRLRQRMQRATELVITERAGLIGALPTFQEKWRQVQPNSKELPVPDLRVAAHVVALNRCRQATEYRGIWP